MSFRDQNYYCTIQKKMLTYSVILLFFCELDYETNTARYFR